MSLSLNTCLFERRGFILLDRDIVSTGIIVKSKRRMGKGARSSRCRHGYCSSLQ